MPRKSGVESFAPGGSWRTRAHMISLSCTRGGLHTSFSEIPDVALVKAVIAHAARLVAQGDTDAAVLDVRRAYFNGGEKRDTFVELPDHVPADMRVSHVGKLRKALYSTRPAAASWGDELGVSCGLVVGTLVLLLGQCMVTTSSLLDLARRRCSRRDGGPGSGDWAWVWHILNRSLRWCRDGLVFAADVRHGKKVIEERSLWEHSPFAIPVLECSCVTRMLTGLRTRFLDGQQAEVSSHLGVGSSAAGRRNSAVSDFRVGRVNCFQQTQRARPRWESGSS